MSDSASPRRSRDGRRRTDAPAPRWALLLVLAGASVFILASCEDDIFPPEEQRDEIERRFSHDPEPPDVSGSANIPVPPTNTENSGVVEWFSTGISVPESVWVKIRVSGTITLGANPEYTENYCSDPSCTPYAGETVSPLGIGYQQLNVLVGVLTSAGQWVSPGLHAVPGSGTDAQVFVFLSAPGVLSVARWGISGGGSCVFNRPPGYTGPGGCPGGTDYHEAGAYTMSGTQVVTVEALKPARVHARRTWFQPGDTITFDAEVEGTPYSLKWFFAVGDTLPEPSNSPNTGTGCPDNQLTCRYAPSAPGRMYIDVWMSDVPGMYRAASQVVRIGEPPPLTLDAVPSMVDSAGQEVEFTAVAEGADSVEVTEWTWTPADSQSAPSTQVCGAGVNPCETAVYESGTMRVLARVDGVPDTATATVSVGAPGGVPTLTCSDGERGDTISCVVGPPEIPLEVTEWKFVGGGFDTIRSSHTGRSWEGVGVISGEVWADIVLDGDSLSVRGDLTITDRAWSWGPADWTLVPDSLPASCHPPYPQAAGDTLEPGRTATRSCHPFSVLPVAISNSGYSVAQGTGPNEGIWYVSSTSFRVEAYTGIHPDLLPGGTVWASSDPVQVQSCNAVLDPDPPAVSIYVFNDNCIPTADYFTYLAYARSHEEHHLDLIAQAASSNDLHARVEDLYAATDSTLYDAVFAAWNDVAAAILNHSKSIDQPYVPNGWEGQIYLWVGVPANRFVLTNVRGVQ